MKIAPDNFRETSIIEEQTEISLKSLGQNYKNWSYNPPITLHWENLNAFTKDENPILNHLRNRKCPSRHIIKFVNGVAKPNSLLAIMGASGAGKSTLLNLLNFRNRSNLKVTGEIKINGSLVTSVTELSSIAGYVQQDDIFFGYLKVKEHLRFQSHLKMAKYTTSKEKEEKVEQILTDMNLKKVANTLIGDPDKGIKGISGGERRRLAFGSELITNPSLMFFDEPTSGLDSYMANSIVDIMSDLAKKGKTIVCTIHQPSSQIFQKFDRLCLLSEGRLAYMGELNEAQKFFTGLGYPTPENFNPADHYINTLAVTETNSESKRAEINKICENFQTGILNTRLNYDLKMANKKETDPFFSVNLNKNVKYNANVLKQFWWLLWRCFLSTIRNPAETHVAVIQTFVISTVLGLIYLKLDYDQPGIQNINGVLFLLIANTSFTYIITVINTFTLEIPIFLRENQNGMYMVITYYLAKIFIDVPKFVILPFFLTTIVYWMTNLNTLGDRFMIACVIIVLVAHTSVAFGGFLSSVAPNVNIGLNLTGPLLPPLMIFSGFFLNNSSTPDYFIWLKYLSWFNYANELLNINQWEGVTNITCNIQDSLCLTTGEQILDKLDMKIDNYSINFVAIFCILIGYRILTLIVLIIKSYRK